MTYYLVDLALVVALTVTTFTVFMMRRELRALRDHQQSYASALGDTSNALVNVGGLIRDLNLQGLNTVSQLTGQIDAARTVIDQLQSTRGGTSGEQLLARVLAEQTRRAG
jgi:hypothetical protein